MDFLLIYFFIFLLGVFIGSFLNCLIYRLEVGEKPEGRSYCPKCKKTLKVKDLVPVFSYIFLKGRCRYCGEKISIQYPLVELSTGVLFAFLGASALQALTVFEVVTTLYLLVVASFLVLIFVYDIKHFIIPDFANFSLIGLSFLYLVGATFQQGLEFFISGVASASGAFLFFFALYYFTKGKGMGFGDVKFVIFMGLFLGFPKILVAFFVSFVLGAIIGLILIAVKKKKAGSQIPFGPFLIIGLLTAHFYGSIIIETYLNYAS
jgi:prepilin signal peptidase PulO-like enzyme (type II secretory pathway)